jgi:predicted Zn-dependent protease
MKNKYILLFLFGFFGIHASAQTLAQAKILYEKGQYEQAKPVFKKFVKSQPNNGNYNLWYGVCCLNTGEAEEAIKYLETAVKRRVTSGQLYRRSVLHRQFCRSQERFSRSVQNQS